MLSIILKAIVVDEREEIVDVLSEILEMNQINVIGKGHGGEEAVELYNEKKPDLVFVADTMPIFDGLDAFREIKQVNPNAMIVFVTSDPLLDNKTREMGLIPMAIIHKPFDNFKISNLMDNLRLSMADSMEKIQQNLIDITMKKVLREIDRDAYKNVISKLQTDHNCSIEDCLDKPDNLRQVLMELHSDNYKKLVNKIQSSLYGFWCHNKIEQVLAVLSKN